MGYEVVVRYSVVDGEVVRDSVSLLYTEESAIRNKVSVESVLNLDFNRFIRIYARCTICESKEMDFDFLDKLAQSHYNDIKHELF